MKQEYTFNVNPLTETGDHKSSVVEFSTLTDYAVLSLHITLVTNLSRKFLGEAKRIDSTSVRKLLENE